MKKNGLLLVVYSMLALLTTAGMMQEDLLTMNGLICWVLTFSFWFLMLLPAWEFKEKHDDYCPCDECSYPEPRRETPDPVMGRITEEQYEQMLRDRDTDTNNYAQSRNEEGSHL